MKMKLMVLVLSLSLVGLGCADTAEPVYETAVFQLTVGDETGTVYAPIDLSALEQQWLAAQGGSGGGGMFGSGIPVRTKFKVSDAVHTAFSTGQQVAASHGAGIRPTTAFSTSSGCDFGGAVCNFAKSACLTMGPLAMELAGAMGEGLGEGPFSPSMCHSIDCSEITGLIPGLPMDLQCAMTGILSCLTGQLSSIASVLRGSISGDMEESDLFALVGQLESQLATCLGPYMGYLESMDLGDVEGMSSTGGNPWDEQQEDPWDQWNRE